MLYDGIASTTKSAWLAISNGMSRKSEQCYILRFLHIWIWTMMMMKQQCTLSGSVGRSGHSLPIVSTSLMSFLFFHRHYDNHRDRHYHQCYVCHNHCQLNFCYIVYLTGELWAAPYRRRRSARHIASQTLYYLNAFLSYLHTHNQVLYLLSSPQFSLQRRTLSSGLKSYKNYETM